MIISLIVGLVIIALIYWCITILPLPGIVKTVATVLLIIGAILWLVRFVPSLNV